MEDRQLGIEDCLSFKPGTIIAIAFALKIKASLAFGLIIRNWKEEVEELE